MKYYMQLYVKFDYFLMPNNRRRFNQTAAELRARMNNYIVLFYTDIITNLWQTYAGLSIFLKET